MALHRRDWLKIGALAPMGLSLPDLLQGRSQARERIQAGSSFGKAKSCIVIFLFGAPAHQDIWDLKPDAPSEYRGEFQPIATTVPGIQVGEHIPQLARLAHRYALIRSVSHPDNTHTVAMHYMLTGHRHIRPATNPRNEPSDFPTFGAVMEYLRRGKGTLPAGVSLNAPANQASANNHIFPGFFAGMIGNQFDPLFIPDDASAEGFQPFPVMPGSAAAIRNGLRQQLEGAGVSRNEPPVQKTFQHFYDRAFQLLGSASARAPFDLSRETKALRRGSVSLGGSLVFPGDFLQGILVLRGVR